jgi:uncharacterized membrane protein YqaE (UPF0057 family)
MKTWNWNVEMQSIITVSAFQHTHGESITTLSSRRQKTSAFNIVVKRLAITIVNIFFPPLAVYLLCGLGEDFLLNCLLFLLAVLPSHIHAFYISFIYFHRKRKIRKGVYPGEHPRGIYSERVQYGGANKSEIKKLRREEEMRLCKGNPPMN